MSNIWIHPHDLTPLKGSQHIVFPEEEVSVRWMYSREVTGRSGDRGRGKSAGGNRMIGACGSRWKLWIWNSREVGRTDRHKVRELPLCLQRTKDWENKAVNVWQPKTKRSRNDWFLWMISPGSSGENVSDWEWLKEKRSRFNSHTNVSVSFFSVHLMPCLDHN